MDCSAVSLRFVCPAHDFFMPNPSCPVHYLCLHLSIICLREAKLCHSVVMEAHRSWRLLALHPTLGTTSYGCLSVEFSHTFGTVTHARWFFLVMVIAPGELLRPFAWWTFHTLGTTRHALLFFSNSEISLSTPDFCIETVLVIMGVVMLFYFINYKVKPLGVFSTHYM